MIDLYTPPKEVGVEADLTTLHKRFKLLPDKDSGLKLIKPAFEVDLISKPRTSFCLDHTFLEFSRTREDLKFWREGVLDVAEYHSRSENLGSSVESLPLQTEPYGPALQNRAAQYKQLFKFDDLQEFTPPDRWNDTLSMFEMIYDPLMTNCGLSSDEVYCNLDLDKSCGPLYNVEYEDKRAYVAAGSPHFARYWTELATPGGGWTLTGSASKDELRPLSKIKENKTRQIFPCSVNHFLAGVHLFFQQCKRLQQVRKTQSIKVGLSRYGKEYESVMSQFIGKGCGVCDGVGWDRRFFRAVHLYLAERRYNWLKESDRTPENYYRILNWYAAVIHKWICMCDGQVWEVPGGQTSGNFLTADDNSFYHELQFMNIFLRLTKMQLDDPKLLDVYYSDWAHAILGDDIIFTSPAPFKDVIEVYDEFLQHEHPGKYLSLEEARFCGQYAVKREGHLVPLPDRGRMISALFWKHKSSTEVITAIRINQIRIHAFWDPWIKEVCDEFHSWFLENRHLSHDDFRLYESTYLSDKDIRELYFEYEAACVSGNLIKRYGDCQGAEEISSFESIRFTSSGNRSEDGSVSL